MVAPILLSWWRDNYVCTKLIHNHSLITTNNHEVHYRLYTSGDQLNVNIL